MALDNLEHIKFKISKFKTAVVYPLFMRTRYSVQLIHSFFFRVPLIRCWIGSRNAAVVCLLVSTTTAVNTASKYAGASPAPLFWASRAHYAHDRQETRAIGKGVPGTLIKLSHSGVLGKGTETRFKKNKTEANKTQEYRWDVITNASKRLYIYRRGAHYQRTAALGDRTY